MNLLTYIRSLSSADQAVLKKLIERVLQRDKTVWLKKINHGPLLTHAEIVERIEYFRRESGLSKTDFAAELNMTQSAYSKLANKRTKNIWVSTVLQASKVLGIHPSLLILKES